MVKVLSRDKVRRFFDLAGGDGTGGGSSIDPSMLVGLATETWVDENYLSIAYFSQLFKAYKPGESAGDPDVEVLPNTIDEDITNVKSMFGFWTEFYLSALGTGGASSVGISLASLSDVDVTGVTNGQFLKWDSTQSKWVPGTASGGTDMATVWANLAAVDATHQIDASHLTTAAEGLFTSLAMDSTALSITIGGTTKTLTVGYASTAGSVAWANVSNKPFYWVAQAGQPLWLWGTNDGTNYYVWDPTTLSVGYCTTTADTANTLYMMGIVSGATTTLKYNSSMQFAGDRIIGTGSTLYLGNANNHGYVYVQDMCSQNGASYWKITQSGDGYFGNVFLGSNFASYINAAYSNSQYAIGFKPGGTSVAEVNQSGFYCNGYVTALSDIRFKNVVERMDVDVKRIAEMSIIKFLWNDRDEGGKLHVGCVAQEWESLLPWTVQEVNGKKSLDYSVAALVSAVAIARKVESHEERIARLERELANERELMAKN